MHEITLVLSDLYFPAAGAGDTARRQSAASADWPDPPVLPGLSLLARFGRSQPCRDWRQWVARWLSESAPAANQRGLQQAAELAPASVAAQILAPALPSAARVWFATPLHLLAGLNSVHLERRGLLRLHPAEAEELAAQFAQVFGNSGFQLRALPGGELLLFGPEVRASAREPARAVGADIAQALPQGPESAPLRRLSAEIEMWLHALPLNAARQRRGELPLNALWPWGAGALPVIATAPVVAASRDGAAFELQAFGHDAWLQGILQPFGEIRPVPRQLPDPFGYPHARRILLVTEIGAALRAHPQWGLRETLVQIDHDFVAPAIAAIRGRGLTVLRILANDRRLELRARDLLKFWRPRRSAIAALD